MIRRYFRLAMLSFICCLSMAGAAHAQEKQDKDVHTINPAKLELIKELIAVTDVANSAKLTMSQAMSSVQSFISSLTPTMPSPSSGQSLTPQQDAQAKKAAANLVAKFSDSLIKDIDFDKLIAAVYIPLYDKYYTEEDLKDLIAFYKTPVGQKSVLVSPMLAADATAKIGEFLLPTLQENIKAFQDQMERDIKQTSDQFERMQKTSPPPPPPSQR